MKANSIQRVSVLGLGTMGHGIAQSFAAAGCQVLCFDQLADARETLAHRVRTNLDLMVEEDVFGPQVAEKIERRILLCGSEAAALEGTQFVTEAVIEDLAVKQTLFERIESLVEDDCILASNTSSFPMTQISEHMRRPQRAVVTHWFNPPHIVPLVEVVPGEKTDPEIARTSHELLGRIGKVSILLAQEVPGFLVNRIQTAIYREIWHLMDQGVASAEDIDRAVRASIGLRLAAMGPIEVSDFAGLDVANSVHQNLVTHICSDVTPPGPVQDLVEAGHLGVKSGKGFFDYLPESITARRSERDRHFLKITRMFGRLG